MKKIVVLTGAGISAESGIKTFRDAGGLWEGHDVKKVASPEGFRADPEMVLTFYNQRRNQLFEVEPNDGHKALVKLEEQYHVQIITQNVDDLHERAGSKNIMHLHGELRKVRSIVDPSLIYDCTKDINLGDTNDQGHQLRPHIVWFGEAVPMIEHAVKEMLDADIVIIVGTSMQVYPAAGLIGYAPEHAAVYFVDPKPAVDSLLANSKGEFKVIAKGGSEGLTELLGELMS